jgi:hypothetical protein
MVSSARASKAELTRKNETTSARANKPTNTPTTTAATVKLWLVGVAETDGEGEEDVVAEAWAALGMVEVTSTVVGGVVGFSD